MLTEVGPGCTGATAKASPSLEEETVLSFLNEHLRVRGTGVKRAVRILVWSGMGLAAFLGILILLAYSITFHPDEIQAEPVHCSPDAPLLGPAPALKLLSWNIQYLAGKSYVFFYDLPGEAGPDERPSPQAIQQTLSEVARVIREESPDLVLLQEVDDGASRTDKQDQLALLVAALPGLYPCHASAFYWKAAFVPHPRILGAVGMKLSILSRYRIARATRYQLPRIPEDPVTRLFSFRRAVLEVELPRQQGGPLAVLNTHLDAFAQGTDTMARQVRRVGEILDRRTREGKPWVLGGDFNLLPSAAAYDRLKPRAQAQYTRETPLAPLLARCRSVPSVAEADGPEASRWYTHFPNDPSLGTPDRTIDYFFLSDDLELGPHRVRQHDTRAISDHFPIVLEARVRPVAR
jgi:endonuclease/exonuclease/phosphatase family metal-dependent hydrolase